MLGLGNQDQLTSPLNPSFVNLAANFLEAVKDFTDPRHSYSATCFFHLNAFNQ